METTVRQSAGSSIFIVLLVFAGIVPLKAQHTLLFSAELSSPTIAHTGQGLFALTDELFTYDVTIENGDSLSETYFFSDIRGPGPDVNGAVIFGLNRLYCVAPGRDGIPPGTCIFRGSEALTESQINELVSGQWYVWAFPFSQPGAPLSGQIIPEPSSFIFAFLAGLGFLIIRKRKN